MSHKDLKKLADSIFIGLKRKGLTHGEIVMLLAGLTGNVIEDMQEDTSCCPPLKSVS